MEHLPADPVALSLLERWGLAPGQPLAGWTAEAIERAAMGNGLLATFSRADVRITVALKRASEQPRFARVGEIDLVHLPVDPTQYPAAAQLTGAVAAWLKAQGEGADLLPLLVDAPAAAPPGPAPRPATAPRDPQSTRTSTAFSLDFVHEAPPLDPANRAPADRPVFPHATVGVDQLGPFSDALGQMYRHQFGCIVIRGVYTPEEMDRVATLLETGAADGVHSIEADSTIEQPEPGKERSKQIGRPLDWAESLDASLEEAKVFRAGLDAVFARAGVAPYETRLQEVLGKIAGGRKVCSPVSADGRNYGPVTVRYLTKGGRYNAHTDTHIAKPNYAELRRMVDPVGHLSQFLTVRQADGTPDDGALIVYSVQYNGLEPSERTDEAGRLDLAQWMAFKPGPGDLLIFDAGRYTHQVTKIVGPGNRITIGGFLMFANGNETIYYMR